MPTRKSENDSLKGTPSLNCMISACSTTRIYCRPDCPPGRRTKPQNRVYFPSLELARALGFRACKVCKPDEGIYAKWLPKRYSVR
ncbi:MAG: hypothetical protein BZY82_10300 [SAR202 cluster bacterium Io17-Chloro-G3]|nr:MAG: hypothetical protein BZY82_10300 [SAR202 cluster bacterium Io17-Chloro-G3]